ncbi:MAG TPA: class I SAM-dependent methyltransferase [Xanthobacteraceae bacterium]|nr:class I SAM-dependent methyltransferase [Xanthobacteraceae bacterium]
MIDDWIAFWNGPNSIYVNARHKDAHYRLLAEEIAALVRGEDARVLDYGCGEALHADRVAAAAGEILLCEAASAVREGLQKRFADNPRIRIVAPHDVARLPDRCLDLIVMHSVVQYLTPAGTGALFVLFHRLLRPEGLLVISDVIQPKVAAAADALALLQFAKANGFFFASLWGLTRTLLSDYWRLRSRLGLTRYTQAAMIEKLDAAGFAGERAPKNIGHNQRRMTFHARPR